MVVVVIVCMTCTAAESNDVLKYAIMLLLRLDRHRRVLLSQMCDYATDVRVYQSCKCIVRCNKLIAEL